MAQDINPWSSEHWDPVAQAAYIKAKGMQRAILRAREAGTTVHGPRPKDPKREHARLVQHRNLVRGIVHRKNRNRGAFISCRMDLGFDADLTAKVTDLEIPLGFNMAVALDREIDIVLNPGARTFSANFHVGFDESFHGFGEQYAFSPIQFRLGADVAQDIERAREIIPPRMGLGFNLFQASFGNVREILPGVIGVGFDQNESRLMDYNIPVSFSLGLSETSAIERYASLSAGMDLGLTETMTLLERAREFTASLDLGFKAETELGDVALVAASFGLGFSYDFSLSNEQYLEAAASLGFNQASDVYRAREIVASFALGFSQSQTQPVMPIAASFALGTNQAVAEEVFFNLISTHSLGLAVTTDERQYLEPTEFLNANSSLGIDMVAAFERFHSFITEQDVGLREQVTVSFDRDVPSDIHMGFDMAASVTLPMELSLAFDMGFGAAVQPYMPFDFAVTMSLGAVISSAHIPTTIPLVVETSGWTSETKNDSAFSFGGLSFGTPGTDRWIVCMIVSGNVNRDVLSVTVDGRSATRYAGASGVSSPRRAEVWAVNLATGTSGSIDFTLSSGGTGGAMVAYWVVHGPLSGVTSFLEDAPPGTTTSYASQAMLVKEGGLFLGCAPCSNNSNVKWNDGSPPLNVMKDITPQPWSSSSLFLIKWLDGFVSDTVLETGSMTAISTGTGSPYIFFVALESGAPPAYVAASNDFGLEMAASLSTTLETVISPSTHSLGFDMSATLTAERSISASMDLGFSGAATITQSAQSMDITYLGSTSLTQTAAAYSFGGQSFGAADPSRYVFVVTNTGGSSRTVVSMTIGGVAATKIIGGSATGLRKCELWMAPVPTGTSGSIDFTMSGTTSAGTGARIDVYRVLSPGGGINLIDWREIGNPPNQPSHTVNVAQGGFIIAVALSTNVNFAWAAGGAGTSGVSWFEDDTTSVPGGVLHKVRHTSPAPLAGTATVGAITAFGTSGYFLLASIGP